MSTFQNTLTGTEDKLKMTGGSVTVVRSPRSYSGPHEHPIKASKPIEKIVLDLGRVRTIFYAKTCGPASHSIKTSASNWALLWNPDCSGNTNARQLVNRLVYQIVTAMEA